MFGIKQVCGQFQRGLILGSARRSAATMVGSPSTSTTSSSILNNTLYNTTVYGTQQQFQNRDYSVSIPRSQSTNMETNEQKVNHVKEDFSQMSDAELAETSTIPGWDLIHSPPGKMPRGALVGTVVSARMDKTVNVAVDRYRIVPKIRKRVKYTRKFMAHDESEVANLGDVVMITPCHRISKMKHFLLRKIVRAKGQL